MAMEQYRALHLTQPSNFRAALKSDEHKFLFGVAIAIPNTLVARQVAMLGYDWAFVDTEHGAMSASEMKEIVHAVQYYSEGRTIPVVRVPAHEPSWIAVALDAGAGGIILPHAETVEQIRALIGEARFPPEGHRSFSPFPWFAGLNDQAPPGETLYSVANKHIAVIPQLESRKGIENAEEILKLPGVDAIMIGAADLALDMSIFGLPGEDKSELLTALDRVRDLGVKHGKPVGGFAFPEWPDIWPHRTQNNFKFLVVAADWISMTSQLLSTRKECHELTADIPAWSPGVNGATKGANGSATGTNPHTNGVNGVVNGTKGLVAP